MGRQIEVSQFHPSEYFEWAKSGVPARTTGKQKAMEALLSFLVKNPDKAEYVKHLAKVRVLRDDKDVEAANVTFDFQPRPGYRPPAPPPQERPVEVKKAPSKNPGRFPMFVEDVRTSTMALLRMAADAAKVFDPTLGDTIEQLAESVGVSDSFLEFSNDLEKLIYIALGELAELENAQPFDRKHPEEVFAKSGIFLDAAKSLLTTYRVFRQLPKERLLAFAKTLQPEPQKKKFRPPNKKYQTKVV